MYKSSKINIKLFLFTFIITILTCGMLLHFITGGNTIFAKEIKYDYSTYKENIEQLKIKNPVKFSDKIEKYRIAIESNLKIELYENSSLISGIKKNKNRIDQIFIFDENNWFENENTIKISLKENRIINYEDGQKGYELIPYDITFNKKNNSITNIQEYDIAGKKYDKNINKITENEIDVTANQFLSKYPKKEIKYNYSDSVPKNPLDQKTFFENKNKELDKISTSIAFRAENNLKLPFNVNVNAASTFDKYGAAAYARYWGNWQNPVYPKYEFDCTNFISQAVHAGGLIKDYNNNDTFKKDWYMNLYFNKSNTWSVATNNADHMYSHENTGNWNRIYPSNAAYILDYGDLIYINDNSGTFHVMMVTGAYWSSPDNKWHALFSQHTTDKVNADFDSAFLANSGKVFWGLNIYGNVWDHI